MLLAWTFFFYFFSLVLFSFISHPVYYCILLVVNSLLCSFICYCVYGFSWYALLFCLVYIGGVYILFVFVSVHNPNSIAVSFWSFSVISSFLSMFFVVILGKIIYNLALEVEFSSFLCSRSEGVFYVSMCLTLLFGFFILSLVMCVKMNYYR